MKFRAIAVLLVCVTVSPAAAEVRKDGALDALLADIEKSEDSVRTLTVEYTQSLESRFIGSPEQIIGKAFFSKPDKIRIEYTKPAGEIFVSNGKNVLLYNPQYNQVFKGTWDDIGGSGSGSGSLQGLPRGFFNFSSTVGTLKENYTIALERQTEAEYVLLLTPKAVRTFTIQLWISRADYMPVKTRILTDTMSIETVLTRIEKNPALPKNIFTFKVPRGAEVLSFPK